LQLKIHRYTMSDDEGDKPATAKQVEELWNIFSTLDTHIPTLRPDECQPSPGTSPVVAVAPHTEYLRLSVFREEFRLLRDEIAAIRKQGKPSSNKESGKSQAKSSCRDRSPTPAQANRTSNICYYHRKFGDKAKKCEKGCARAHSGN